MSALEEYYRTRDPFGEDHSAADAAIESLKCCGNCRFGNLSHGAFRCRGPLDNYKVRALNPCRFTPSRWQDAHNDAGSDT